MKNLRLNLLLGLFLVFLAQKDLENDITIWNHSRSQLAIGNFFFEWVWLTLLNVNSLFDRSSWKSYGYGYFAICVYERDYQLCKTMPPPGGCWISGASVHFWQNTSTSDSTYSFGKNLSALRHIAITVQREEESAESYAVGKVVPYSQSRVF